LEVEDDVKVMVTGGAGFLAGHLIECLLQEGHDVRTVELPDHVTSELEDRDTEIVRGDLRDPDVCARSCEGMEIVFHLAALASSFGPRDRFWSINVTATDNVIAACKRAGVRRLVQVSSASAICDGKDHIMADESLPYPKKFLCHYSETKAISEQRALAANGSDLEAVVIRPHAVWGPRDHTLLPRIIARAQRGRLSQIGDGENEFSMLFVHNGVDALALAITAEAAPGKVYFITDEERVKLWDFIRTMLDGLNIPAPRRAISFRTAYALGSAMEAAYSILKLKGEPTITRYTAVKLAKNHSYSIARARADLGYQPKVSVEEGLRKMYEWVDEKGLPEMSRFGRAPG
jgi:nucleoside-diphosphate-sugar epimerase